MTFKAITAPVALLAALAAGVAVAIAPAPKAEAATQHNVWDTFRTDNGLPLDAKSEGPIIGGLNLNDILKSSYIYS